MPLIGGGCNAADRPKTRHLRLDLGADEGRAGAGTEQARKARGVGSAPGPRDWPLQNKNCVCSKAGISFRAMESAATIPHAHGEHCVDEADDEGG
jgi:hypothetical protein